MLKKIFIFIILFIISPLLLAKDIIPVDEVFLDIDKNYKYYNELQELYNK
jgi:hypothetical protein